MRTKAAFFDWDGTLSADGARMVPANREAIRRLRKLGHYAFLCTGRATALTPEEAREEFDGIVTGVGAYVRLHDQMVYRRYIPAEVVLETIDHFVEVGQNCIFEGETGMFVASASGWEPPSWLRVADREEFQRLYGENVISKLTIHGAVRPETEAFLLERYDLVRHETYVEAVVKGCSKASGMRRMLEAIGVPPEDSWAFGDSFNDRDMIEAAGVGVAMANAPEGVRAVADRVTIAADRGGVAAAIDALLAEEDDPVADRRVADR